MLSDLHMSRVILYLFVLTSAVKWKSDNYDSHWNYESTFPETFVLMKTSWRRLSSSSSEDVFKTSWSRPIYSSWLYVFKTSSRHLQDVLPRRLQDVFKTSSRRLAKTSSRHLQDVFKTYHQVKLFLLTRLWEAFNTFLRRSFPKTVIYRGICLSNTISDKFMVSEPNLQEINISKVLVFHFTTCFSGCLGRRI